MKIVSICFVGFGNAARRLAEILLQFSDEIYRRYSIKIRCSAISTARHSSVVSRRANKIDLEHALNLVKAGKQLTELENVEEVESAIQAIAKSGADIVIETTTLNPYDGEPALSHVAFALKSRKHVVSANKGPVAYALPYLKTLAKEQKVSFRYESTVMDGAPIFNLVEQCLPLVKVDSIFGIVNSTTNFILSQMELGVDFGNALSEAQKMGIAEADPSFDLDGWDAAVKLSVLANSIMQAELRPSQVSRVSISSLNRRSLRENYKRGFKTRVIARVTRYHDSVRATVQPETFDQEHILFPVDNFSNALVLETDLMGRLGIFEYNPDITQTAYGLLSDFIKISQTYLFSR